MSLIHLKYIHHQQKSLSKRKIIWMVKNILSISLFQKEGIHTIPAFSLSYFSPKEKAYKTLTTDQLVIDVVSGVKLLVRLMEVKRNRFIKYRFKLFKASRKINKTSQYEKRLGFIFYYFKFCIILLIYKYILRFEWGRSLSSMFSIKTHDKAIKALGELEKNQVLGKQLEQISSKLCLIIYRHQLKNLFMV